MQYSTSIISLIVCFGIACGCGKPAAGTPTVASNKTTPPATTPKPGMSGPNAIMTTQYPTDDHLVLTWSFTACKEVKFVMGGQTIDMSTTANQIKLKADLKRDPRVDQVNVTLETSEGTKAEGSAGTYHLSVGGLPTGDNGKPMAVGSLLNPAITKSQSLNVGEAVLLAKGAGAFPSLTVQVVR